MDLVVGDGVLVVADSEGCLVYMEDSHGQFLKR